MFITSKIATLNTLNQCDFGSFRDILMTCKDYCKNNVDGKICVDAFMLWKDPEITRGGIDYYGNPYNNWLRGINLLCNSPMSINDYAKPDSSVGCVCCKP